ncbi:FYVE, RhoGEF and PH domain-containing protein 5-like isoform X2 [Boleophthalmus pectinirostris]|uniref:FYVE, RhoGEF and PH domain-containing protein 5-like isoform X2 n=1 Tax=Boleophthalmus pectinirostris TaxID=150288 RepID=UPI0024322DBC|nr:FYVE, RhoGEF and PH domain-containing protein 5-like isoform X2 [Boleophthalmus pectinirostris]
MNSDWSKPPPVLSSHSPLMSSTRGPKPSVAPKPRKLFHNGMPPELPNQVGYPNGSLKCNFIDNGNVLKMQDVVQIVLKNGDENKRKIDEDWRLSTLTEKTDSLETLDTVEEVDSTEDVVEVDVYDGGEAMADTDGISMGDISVNSIGLASEDKMEDMKDSNTDCNQMKAVLRKDLSPTNNTASPKLKPFKFHKNVYTQKQCNEEQNSPDLKLETDNLNVDSNKLAQVIGKNFNITNNNASPKVVQVNIERIGSFNCQKNAYGKMVAMQCNVKEEEPEYVFPSKLEIGDSNSNCNQLENMSKDLNLKNNNTSPKLVSVNIDRVGSFKLHKNPYRNSMGGGIDESDYVLSEEYVEIGSKDKTSDSNTFCTCPDKNFGIDKQQKAPIFEHCSNSPDCQPRFRLVSISKARETQLSSSLSELLFPSDLFDKLDSPIAPFDLDFNEDHVYDTPGRKTSIGARTGSMSQRSSDLRSYKSGIVGHSGSPMLVRHAGYQKPHYLPLYPRSLSMEGQEMQGSPMRNRAMFANFSQNSPLSTPTSVVEIPPPFELAYITKKPITKSSPSLLIETDPSEKNKKKKSSLKRFLMLKFKRKGDNKQPAISPTSRLTDLDTHSLTSSPNLNSRSQQQEPAFLHYDSKKKGGSVSFLNRSIVRVESFNDRSHVPFAPLPLTKPRSISFPITDNSDYENVPAINSDYENVQVPQRRPMKQFPFTEYFERSNRQKTTANDTDGYVDMSSLPGFEKKVHPPQEETESAYTEAYNVCSVAVAPVTDEEQGPTSDEEGCNADSSYQRQPDGLSRAYYVAKELLDTERQHVKLLKLLHDDFREAVLSAVDSDGQPVVQEERLREILIELPDVYSLHHRILSELEGRIRLWSDSQKIADIFLMRKPEFLVFTTFIGHYDRSVSLLEESCRTSPGLYDVVQQFEISQKSSLKHQLLQVIVRVAQYRMLLTDYLNNLSPDSQEYEDTQAAVTIVSDIAYQANDSLKNGENLLRLVNIDYSVRGQRDLLQPGRVFIKEGTLMKVSRKSRQPRHLFLMNDVLLYTFPQQDGKYRLKNTLQLTGLKVSKPIVDSVQNALRIESEDLSITLSASSFIEREEWFFTLSHTVNEHARGSAPNSPSDPREPVWSCLGEKAPTFVPLSEPTICMSCTSEFSLTSARQHCHSCGRVVCRNCSKNRFPLKYMRYRMAKVCEHCYSELKKKGEDTAPGADSPRPARSRPLSAVFQNIHTPKHLWRHRRGTLSFNQVMVCEEGALSGSLQRSKTKRNWKRLWFLLKDKEKVASETLPLLGFTVKLPDRVQGEEEATVFQLYHKNTLFYTFKAEDNFTAQRWANAMEEATVL